MDVANATVMVIMGARRFGLSQLHQLRGQGGAGRCRITLPAASRIARRSDALERLRLFARTADGFALAEADLRLRGEGQLFGERQSGLGDLRVARLLQDGALLEEARGVALALLDQDPLLRNPPHRLLAEAAEERFGGPLARHGLRSRVEGIRVGVAAHRGRRAAGTAPASPPGRTRTAHQ